MLPGEDNRASGNASDDSGDYPYADMKLSAPSVESGGSAGKAADGDNGTIWHSNWGGGQGVSDLTNDPDNRYLQIELQTAEKITGLRYRPRSSQKNGTVTKYSVKVSTDGQTWTEAASGDWTDAVEWKLASFKTTEAKYIRMYGVETSSDGGTENNKFMSAAEVRIRLASEELHSGNTTVTLAQDFVDYTGKEITPEPTVSYKASEAAEEITLVKGTVQPLEDALYTVAFQSNGGSEVASQQIAVASGRIAEPAAPKRRGYVFAGWYRDIALTQKWNFAADKAESDLTLYAKWTEAEIVVNTDIPDYLLGHTWNLPGTIRVTMEEETFDVSVIWNAEDVAAVRAAEEPQSCTIRGVLTYQFALEAGTYNITAGFFDPWAQWAGDQRHAKVSLSDREGKELDAKEDYHISGSKDKVQFTEVELAEDGSLYLNVAPRNSGNDNCDIMISFIVITRKAEETAEYTVTFDAGDGIETVSQQVSEGDKAAKPADPKRDGYTFDGWFKDEACRQAWDFDTDIVTEDITLYAGWTKQEEPDNPEKPDNPDDPDDDLRKTLGEAIRLAEMLKAEDYTKETYDVQAEAIAGAREACEAEELTDEQMQEQMDQLAQAAAGLKTVQKEQNEILLDQLEEKKQELLDKIKELEAAVGKLYA